LQKIFENILIGFFFFRRNSKTFLIFNFLLSFFIFDISKADTNFSSSKNNEVKIEYLDSRKELEDYIIDTGDSIVINFYPAIELSGIYTVNEEGELFLPKLDQTFVRGLTTSELKKLLEESYSEFLIEPDIKLRIAVFKSIRVLVRGEIRNPGFYEFPSYTSRAFTTRISETAGKDNDSELDLLKEEYNNQLDKGQDLNLGFQSSGNFIVKRVNKNIISISDVIRKAGGITSSTDLSKIEIIRDVPLGKGGGKKRAIIDFNAYIKKSDPTNDIRIFDGDSFFFPKLIKKDPSQIPESILSGISPKFIKVNIFGRVDNPGIVKLPLEATLSDAINLTGPVKPLSGKIVLIRYEKDGTVLTQNIAYSANAKRGSKRNPFLKPDDLISVKNSLFGKTTEIIREFTEPFVGIYSTKELIEAFGE
jgi:polysaccharide export outer membrane protein